MTGKEVELAREGKLLELLTHRDLRDAAHPLIADRA